MKLTITQVNGDFRTWICRRPHNQFTVRQVEEISAFRHANPLRDENEQEHPDPQPTKSESMKLIITKRNGDSRTWVGRLANKKFTASQTREIEAFRDQAYLDAGERGVTNEYVEEHPIGLMMADDRIVLPPAAKRYVEAVETEEKEIIDLKRQINGLEERFEALQADHKHLKRKATIDAVMTDVHDDSACYLVPRELIAIREEILRQLGGA